MQNKMSFTLVSSRVVNVQVATIHIVETLVCVFPFPWLPGDDAYCLTLAWYPLGGFTVLVDMICLLYHTPPNSVGGVFSSAFFTPLIHLFILRFFLEPWKKSLDTHVYLT